MCIKFFQRYREESFLMVDRTDFAGLAALTICEALLLSLQENKILSQREVRGILNDAADAHRNFPGAPMEREAHQEVANLIESILAGGNSTGRS